MRQRTGLAFNRINAVTSDDAIPAAPPPSFDVKASLNQTRLAPGTRLWRVHNMHRFCSAFREVPADTLFGGGQFDATSRDPFPSFTLRQTRDGPSGTLTRSYPFSSPVRYIPRAALDNLVLSALELNESLILIALLSGADLAARLPR
jgi:hypothetical protein